jgi:hypothetical protein
MNLLLKAFLGFWLIWLIFQVLKVSYGYYLYHHYRKEGVPFMNPKFTIFSDMLKLIKIVDEFPNTFSFWRMTAKHIKIEPPPPVVGICLFGNPMLFF